jgi:hypothetical protein
MLIEITAKYYVTSFSWQVWYRDLREKAFSFYSDVSLTFEAIIVNLRESFESITMS